jgi:hypothetical protein
MVAAQDGVGARAPNPSLTLEVGATAALDDDDDGAALGAQVGLAYVTRTRDQSLAFTIDTDLATGDGSDLRDVLLPRLGLDYAFDNGSTLLEFDARYAVRRVDGLILEFDEGLEDIVAVEDDGRLETLRAAAELSLWRQDPVGLELGAEVLRRDFRDTSDPDLADSERRSFDAALRLTPRPGLTFRLTADRSVFEEDDLSESETVADQVGLRATWDATPATRVDLSVGYSEREEERNVLSLVDGVPRPTGARETIETSGLVFAAAIVQDRPNGTRSLDVSRRLLDDDSLTVLELGRALALPGGGTLEAQVGISAFEDGDAVATGRLAYGLALPEGTRLRASLVRGGAQDDDNRAIAQTRGQVSLDRPLTPTVGVGVDAVLARVDVLEGEEADETAGSVSLRYDQRLTEDWALTARYTHARSREDGGETRSDDRLSLGVSRSFVFRP